MADDITLSGGEVLATDQNPAGSNEHYQWVKIAHGASNTFTETSSADPYPVTDLRNGGVTLNPTLTRSVFFKKDGTGALNANSDWSSAAGLFQILPDAGRHWLIRKVTMVALDVGTSFELEDAGFLGATATNGIGLTTRDISAGTIIDELLDSSVVIDIRDWLHHGTIDRYSVGTTNTLVQASITFPEPIHIFELSGGGEKLSFDLTDDFSGLGILRFSAQIIDLTTANHDDYFTQVK